MPLKIDEKSLQLTISCQIELPKIELYKYKKMITNCPSVTSNLFDSIENNLKFI